MPEFDPYLKWLGIREATRPVNHYRLLGLELFESDRDVISMAADRQMAHIRTYQSGPNGKFSQQILNQLARARRCLLSEEKKLAYDQKLRVAMSGQQPAAGQPSADQASIVTAQVAPNPNQPPSVTQPPSVSQPTIQPSIVQPTIASSQDVSPQPKMSVRTDPNAREKTKSREKKQLIISLIGWVTGGIAALGVGAFLLKSGILGRQPKPDPGIEVVKIDDDNPGEVKPGDVEPSDVEPGSTKPGELEPSGDKPGREEPADVKPGDVKPIDVKDGSGEMVWTLKNIGEYPAPNAAERFLLVGARLNVKANRVKRLGSSATGETDARSQEYVLGLDPGQIMVGASYRLDDKSNIKTVQPIFRSSDSLVHKAVSQSQLLLAKPGYMVGAVEASTQRPMHGVRFKFMKATLEGLDPKDSYFSPWIGRSGGQVTTISNPKKAPIVATYSYVVNDFRTQTIGLIAADKSFASTDDKTMVAKSDPPKNSGTTGDTNIKAPFAGDSTNTPASGKENIVGKSLPVVSKSPIPSGLAPKKSDADKATMVFINKLDESVTVYRYPINGSPRSYRTISPGSRYSLNTSAGTYYHVKSGGKSVATFRAEPGKNTALVNNRAPDIAGGGSMPIVKDLKKAAIPSSSDRSKAMKKIEDVYPVLASKIDPRKTSKNRQSAESLISGARSIGDDLAMQYVMLESAKEISIETGDSATAIKALRELEVRFEGFDFWDEAVSAVTDSGRALGRSGNRILGQELEQVLRSLIDEAIQSDQARCASKLVTYGMKAANRNADPKSVAYFTNKDKEVDEVTKLHKQYESALVKLTGDPKNASANDQKGKYLIAVKGDYDGALACWAFSKDDQLLAIVKDETSTGATAAFLAKRWQNLGEDPSTLFGRRCYERAIEVLKAAGKSLDARALENLLEQ